MAKNHIPMPELRKSLHWEIVYILASSSRPPNIENVIDFESYRNCESEFFITLAPELS